MSGTFNCFFILYLFASLSVISVLSEPASFNYKDPRSPEPEALVEVENEDSADDAIDFEMRSLSSNKEHRQNIVTNEIDKSDFADDPLPPPPPPSNFHQDKILSPPVQLVEEPSFFSLNGMSNIFGPLTNKFDNLSVMLKRGKEILVAIGMILLLAFLKITVFSWGAKKAVLSKTPRDAPGANELGYTAAVIEAIDEMSKHMKFKAE